MCADMDSYYKYHFPSCYKVLPLLSSPISRSIKKLNISYFKLTGTSKMTIICCFTAQTPLQGRQTLKCSSCFTKHFSLHLFFDEFLISIVVSLGTLPCGSSFL